jgi:hypothetical protein
MIIAAALLSGAVVAISAITTRSVQAVNQNLEYELAWELLDRQLTVIDKMGISEFVQAGEFSGQLGSEEDGGKVHYWQVSFEQLETDDLYKINITVSWGPEQRPRNISAATILNGNGTIIDYDEDGEDEDGQDQEQPNE